MIPGAPFKKLEDALKFRAAADTVDGLYPDRCFRFFKIDDEVLDTEQLAVPI